MTSFRNAMSLEFLRDFKIMERERQRNLIELPKCILSVSHKYRVLNLLT